MDIDIADDAWQLEFTTLPPNVFHMKAETRQWSGRLSEISTEKEESAIETASCCNRATLVQQQLTQLQYAG